LTPVVTESNGSSLRVKPSCLNTDPNSSSCNRTSSDLKLKLKLISSAVSIAVNEEVVCIPKSSSTLARPEIVGAEEREK